MAEELEEKPSQPFEMGRYLDIVRRRHMLFLILLLAVWALVWGSSWFLPERYKSSTLILVEEPALPKNYVVSNVNDNLQDRLQSIEQQILSRTRLLVIIDKLHLYQAPHTAFSADERVKRMRKDIDIQLVKDPQNGAITAFRVIYTAPDAHTAQQVVGELTKLFINENQKVIEQESQSTTQFIQTQLATARAGLTDQEKRVQEFQAAHAGELPTQEAANLQILSGLQQQLQNEQDSLNTAKQQRVYHQSMVDQYRTIGGTRLTASGVPAATGLEALDEQIGKLRAKLQELSTRYTDQYPEVQQTKSELAQAEAERQQMAASLRRAAAAKQSNAADQAKEPEDTVKSGPLLQLQGQLQADQLEIDNRERAIKSLESRIGQYQSLLDREPAVGQQLADLTRGYEQSQANYNDLLKKESDSQMATSMEQMQEGERFMMLDPPSLPQKPDFPNRLKMCGVGLVAGIALGMLTVFLLEFMDDRIYSDQELKNIIPANVICEIPLMLDPSDTKRGKRKTVLGWAMATLVIVVILSGSAFSYLHS